MTLKGRGWLATDKAELHAAHADNMIAAIEKLDSPLTLLGRADLVVRASLQTFESDIFGFGCLQIDAFMVGG